jgi:hypothetical protein
LEKLGVSEGDYVDEVLLEKTNREEKLESIQAILDIIKSDTGRSCTQTAKALKVSPRVLTDVIDISDAAKKTPEMMTTVEVELILLQYFVGIDDPVRELVSTLIDMYPGDIEEEITREEWAPHYGIIKARYPRLKDIAHFLCSYNAETYRRTLLAMRDALNLE